MKTGLIALIVVGVLVLGLLIVGGSMLSARNSLVAERESINGAWSQVDTVLQRRADLIPNLVETVKGFTTHEQEAIDSVTKARAEMAGAKTPADKIYVSGFNGQRNALEAVKKGGLFREDIGFPNAVYEYAVGQFCCDWIEGKSIPSVMDLDILVGNASTIDQLLADDSNPKAAFASGLSKYVTLLGNTSYSRPNYTPTGITS